MDYDVIEELPADLKVFIDQELTRHKPYFKRIRTNADHLKKGDFNRELWYKKVRALFNKSIKDMFAKSLMVI